MLFVRSSKSNYTHFLCPSVRHKIRRLRTTIITFIVTLQLKVTRSSIRNSCNVSKTCQQIDFQIFFQLVGCCNILRLSTICSNIFLKSKSGKKIAASRNLLLPRWHSHRQRKALHFCCRSSSLSSSSSPSPLSS